ncbi:matrixin family metalloprotease [Pseudomonas chlororaphis]|uniref:matrixin family metalloprotease n=1 Tax=Pseudomonas chlororaphis TaxID=587753 RepID=UPI002D78178C|nr:matrixin family metalloprotease [Pseudomonas chlororaphis]
MKISALVPKKLDSSSEIPDDWLKPSVEPNPFLPAQLEMHRYGEGLSILCCTEKRGYRTPDNRKPVEIVLDASDGFIPLWEINRTLHYRFHEGSMRYFQTPDKAKSAIRTLFAEAVFAWGDSAPILFREDTDTYDFEIYMNQTDDGSDQTGYVLASAFFPGSGRDKLTLYPKMFQLDREEQIETLVHEIGHVFGLRHFFAADLESAWPAVIYGENNKFSIMNYGDDSKLTEADCKDLKALYSQVWSGALQKINGTPIVQVKPYHDLK